MDSHADSGDPPVEGASPGSLALRYAAVSDVGRVRKDNQDSGYASPHLLVVADGVGGAARGDLASSTAVAALRRADGPPTGDSLEVLAGAVHRAHDRIAELVEQDPELDGTSTTVTSVLFDGRRIGVAHVGDSRGYLLREGALSQLTRDHTFVQSLVDEGRITEEESRSHPHRNLILRAVDGVHDTDPDLFYVDLSAGDRLLLCSDGASGVLDPDRLADILGTGTVDYAAVELVRASLEAGSTDNVTCVVADVVDAGTAGATGDAGHADAADVPAGPLLVGAAADLQRRGQASKGFFRGHRGGDTGELEPVPGDADRPGPDPEELRYAPRAPRRGRRLRRAVVLVVAVAVVVGAALLAWRWSQDQYFVAAHDGRVAIYQGVQADIPGVRTSHVAEETALTVAALPDYPTEQVATGIPADTLREARAVVARLRTLARRCPAAPPTPAATASASPRPTRTAAPRPTATGSPGATRSPSPSASSSPRPTSTLAPPDCIEATR